MICWESLVPRSSLTWSRWTNSGVQSSEVSTQPSASTDSGDTSDNASKGEIAELVSHGGKAPSARPLDRAPAPTAEAPPIAGQRAPQKPNPYQQWAEQKYMKALESSQLVSAFHSSSLEVPQARTQGATSTNASAEAMSESLLELSSGSIVI